MTRTMTEPRTQSGRALADKHADGAVTTQLLLTQSPSKLKLAPALLDELEAAVRGLDPLPITLRPAVRGDHDYGLRDPVCIDLASVLSLIQQHRETT